MMTSRAYPILTTLAIVACAPSRSPSAPGATGALPISSRLTAEIREAEEQWARGIINADTVALTRLLASEFVLVGPDASRPPFPRAAWMANVATKRVYTDTVSISEFHVRGTADSAVATLLYFWRPIVEGKRMADDPTRLEDTWVRRDGRWQVVQRRRLDVPPDR
jgi:hypothetical protein